MLASRRSTGVRPPSGRRILMWLFRALVVVVLLLLLVLGLKQAVTGLLAPNPIVIGSGKTPPSAKTAAAAYPTDEADALAMRFALAYETYNSSNPQARMSALAPYLPSGADLTMGWNGQGQQTAELAVPTTIHVDSKTQALVTVAVLTSGGQWIYLGVPVYAQGAEVVVTGTPALVPAPAKANYQAPTPAPGDGQLANQLQPNLSAFFTAYAASSQTDLSYYATRASPSRAFKARSSSTAWRSFTSTRPAPRETPSCA